MSNEQINALIQATENEMAEREEMIEHLRAELKELRNRAGKLEKLKELQDEFASAN